MRALRWATASTGRLIGVLLLIGAVVVAALSSYPSNDPTPADPQLEPRCDAPSEVVSAGEHPSPTPRRLECPTGSPAPTLTPPTATPTLDPRVAATEAARAYLSAFFAKTGTYQQWHTAFDRYSTLALAALNDDLPREVVPRLGVRSLRVTGLTPRYAELRAVMSDGSTLFVAVVLDDQGCGIPPSGVRMWCVNEVAPV